MIEHFDLSGLQIKVIDGEISEEPAGNEETGGGIELMATRIGAPTGGGPDTTIGKTIFVTNGSPSFSNPIANNGYDGLDDESGGNAGYNGTSNTVTDISGPGYGTNPDGTRSAQPGQGYGYGGKSGDNNGPGGGYYWRIIFHN
jgi:hypothetical protein